MTEHEPEVLDAEDLERTAGGISRPSAAAQQAKLAEQVKGISESIATLSRQSSERSRFAPLSPVPAPTVAPATPAPVVPSYIPPAK